jgi:dATP pyrophosphohydrolase
MTSVRTSLVDVYVLRGEGTGLECLVLRRGRGGRCPGSWETVHGHIEAAERPAGAAARELEEETGLTPVRLYNLSRVELFYQHRTDEVALVPVFAAFVAGDAAVGRGGGHRRVAWGSLTHATPGVAGPRGRRALDDIVTLLGSGSAGPVDDVLRVC